MKTLIKKTLVLLLVVISASACAQNGGFGFRRVQTKAELDAIVVTNTNTSHSRRGYVHATGLYYIWNGTVWVEEQEIARILGSIPPAYSPTTEQAYTAINDDGDLFVWDGANWILKGDGIYGGSGIVPDSTIATIDNGLTFQSDTTTGEFTIDMDQGLYGSYFKQTPDTVYAEYYDLSGTNSITVDDDGILLKAETPDNVFVDGVLQLQDLTTALLTDSASFIVGADSTGNTSRIKIGSNLTLDGDTLNATSNVTNFGSGLTGEVAIWRADTLYGDSRFMLVGDTVRSPRAVFRETQGYITPSITAGISSLSKESLLDSRSPLSAFWARHEGDGDWVSTFSVHEGNIILQEIDGGSDGEPRIQFYSARGDTSLIPQVPLINDDVFYFRGIKHKGLNPSRDIYTYGAGVIPFRVKIDTVWTSTGNLSFRTEIGAADNVSGVFGGNADITIDRSGDLRFRTYLSSRNDPGSPINILSTNNLGDLRSHPISDLVIPETFQTTAVSTTYSTYTDNIVFNPTSFAVYSIGLNWTPTMTVAPNSAHSHFHNQSRFSVNLVTTQAWQFIENGVDTDTLIVYPGDDIKLIWSADATPANCRYVVDRGNVESGSAIVGTINTLPSWNSTTARYEAIQGGRKLVSYASSGTIGVNAIYDHLIHEGASPVTFDLQSTPDIVDFSSAIMSTVTEVHNVGSNTTTVSVTGPVWQFVDGGVDTTSFTLAAGESCKLIWKYDATPANARYYVIRY